MSYHLFHCLLAAIFLITIFQGRGASDSCPHPCSCTYKGQIIETLDCSNLNWKSIPPEFIFPPSVINISLANNLLVVLNNGTFRNLTNLQSLDISYNRLTALEYSCFEGLESLIKLKMSFNNLKMTTGIYAPGIFRYLKHLKVLSIHGNIRQSTPGQTYPDVALSDLEMLEILEMDGLTDMIFGQGFRKLKYLTVLDMTAKRGDGFCELIDVYYTTFSSFSDSSLSVLKLVQCNIYRIAPGAFSMLKHLTELDLSDNHHIAFDGMKNASFGLNLTNIQILRLNAINRYSNPWTLQNKHFVYFNTTNLKTLTLDSNKITKIEKDVIELLPMSLENLSFRKNILTDGSFSVNIIRLKNLVVLDISYQLAYRHVTAPIYPIRRRENKDDKKERKSFRSAITASPSFTKFWDVSRPQQIATRSNQYLSFRPDNHTVDHDFYLPIKLRKIYASHLKLDPLTIPAFTFNSNNSLEYCDLSSNGLHAWFGKLSGLHSLTMLDFSYNAMFRLAPDSFGDMPNLHTLFLNGNRLGVTIMQDTHFLTFSNQTKLTYLNLSDNSLTDLPELIFAKQTTLEKLDIHHNFLSAINFRMKSLEKIKEINLSNNTIRSLTRVNMEEIDYLVKRSNFTIDLTGNPLQCTCDQLEQLRWMVVTKFVFRNLERYTCKANNGSIVSLGALDDMVGQMGIDCITGEVIIICVAVFCGLSFILTVAALAYYKKSRLVYLFSVGRKHINPLGTNNPTGTNIQDGEENEEQKKFTVYLSIEPSRLVNDFVFQLKEHLQTKGVSVCIPELDMRSGAKENISIVQAMNNSACILALIDNAYMTSFHRLFEFEVAVIEGIQNRFKNLIVVLLKDLDSRHLQMNDFVAMYCRENHFFDDRRGQERLFMELENEIIRYKEFTERKK